MVLTIVYNTQDYQISGLCPSSGIIKNTKEWNIFETGSVSISGEGWEIPTLLGPLESANLSLGNLCQYNSYLNT
jgi:hypothetical protein